MFFLRPKPNWIFGKPYCRDKHNEMRSRLLHPLFGVYAPCWYYSEKDR